MKIAKRAAPRTGASIAGQPAGEPGARSKLGYLPQRRIGPYDQFRPQRWNWDMVKHPLDSTLARHATEPITTQSLANLRYFWLDGIFSSTSEAFYLTFIPLFALAYGATNEQIGWITAIGNLAGALALFPGAQMAEKFNRRDLVVWTGGGIARIALLLLCFVPLFTLPPTVAIIAITLLNGLRAFMANFCNPAWTALVADLVPNFMRGRYFSTRNFTMGLATLVFTAVAGWLIATGNGLGGYAYLGYQFTFLLAFITGMGSTYYFSRIVEEPQSARVAQARPKGQLRHALRHSPGYLGFVISNIVWNFALQIAGPFFNIYLVSNLGASAATVGIVTAISSFTGLFGQLLFGKLVDKRGSVWLTIVTGFPIVLLPIAWAFYRSPWEVGVNNLFGGFLWAGFNLANFNLLLQLTPNEGRSRAVALYQTGVFAAAVVGPLVGGYVCDHISYQAAFWLSGFGRLVAMLIFIWMTALPLRKLTQGKNVQQD